MSPTSLHGQVIFLIFMVRNKALSFSFFMKLAFLCLCLKKRPIAISPFCPGTRLVPPPYLLQEYHTRESPLLIVLGQVYLPGLPAAWTLVFSWAAGEENKQPPIQIYHMKERRPLREVHHWNVSFKMKQQHYGRCCARSSSCVCTENVTTTVWVAALLGCHTQKGSNTSSQSQLLPLDDVQLHTFPDTMTATFIQQKSSSSSLNSLALPLKSTWPSHAANLIFLLFESNKPLRLILSVPTAMASHPCC